MAHYVTSNSSTGLNAIVEKKLVDYKMSGIPVTNIQLRIINPIHFPAIVLELGDIIGVVLVNNGVVRSSSELL